MKLKNTALLTGPYDWDPDLLPLAEFESRLAAVRRVLAEHGASALLVHGHSVEHGALAYLTGFVPKLGPAFALVPLDSPIRILASGGPGMMRSAKLLTWIEDVRAISSLRVALDEWFREISNGSPAVLGLWGGHIMAQRPYLAVAAATQSFGTMLPLDDPLDALRWRKSQRELQLLREACRTLVVAHEAFERATRNGSGARSAALAAERAAYANGAQDVRILVSARDGGPPLPLVGPDDIRVAPLLACLAARYAGYWAEGLVTVASRHGGAFARAEDALQTMLREVRAGASSKKLIDAAAQRLGPYGFHPLVQPSFGNGIGLSFEEPPRLSGDDDWKLEPGGVYTLRCGAMGVGRDNAIVSAMVVVGEAGGEILWTAAGRTGNPK